MMSIILLLILFVKSIFANEYYVKLSNDGPVIIGAKITFRAQLFLFNHKIPEGSFKYKWKDNLYPQNSAEFTGNAESNWTIDYSPEKYEPGDYEVEVNVFTPTVLIDWPICNQRSPFYLNDLLVGEIVLKQNNIALNTQYVSNSTEVKHEIQLNPPDAAYIRDNFNVTTAHWFIDCFYVGHTSGLQFNYNYTKPDVSHNIDVFVDASHLPVNNSFQNTPFTIPVTSTEVDIFNGTTMSSENKSDNVIGISDNSDNKKLSYQTINSSTNNSAINSNFPFNCSTKNITERNSNHSYGLFSKKIKIKAPVENVQIVGSGWLQHGDMLNLQVWCNGSAPFNFCVKFLVGDYNVTGNETCMFENPSASCNFPISYYFGSSTHYTILLIIRNDINKYITKVGVDVYEVTKHPQLSVIIVPVFASIIAAVLIIFGIAYYIQNRNRYIVEVADFDFSNTNDMEYKTFHERLMEAVYNAFNKTEDFSEQESYNEMPTNKKYGSMQ